MLLLPDPPDCKLAPTSKQGADLALAAQLWDATEALLTKALAGELKHLAPAKQVAPQKPAAAAEPEAVTVKTTA